MPKCEKGHDNPEGEIFCRVCGDKIAREPEPEHLDPDEVVAEIQALKETLFRRDQEIEALEKRLQAITAERDELVGKHPEVEEIVRQLDQKDRELQESYQELERLRKLVAGQTLPVPSKTHLLIESFPIANPALGATFSEQEQSLDLSTTGFRIRASLERGADGSVTVAIHPGATINVKTPGEKRWRRVEGGARLSTEAGMILFDPKGIVNARLDRSS